MALEADLMRRTGGEAGSDGTEGGAREHVEGIYVAVVGYVSESGR